jgi:hypothetical protein
MIVMPRYHPIPDTEAQSLSRCSRVTLTGVLMVFLALLGRLGLHTWTQVAHPQRMQAQRVVVTAHFTLTQSSPNDDAQTTLGTSESQLVVDDDLRRYQTLFIRWSQQRVQGWQEPMGELSVRYARIFRSLPTPSRACLYAEATPTIFVGSLAQYVLLRPLLQDEVRTRRIELARDDTRMLLETPDRVDVGLAGQLQSPWNRTADLHVCETEQTFVARQQLTLALILVVAIGLLVVWGIIMVKA